LTPEQKDAITNYLVHEKFRPGQTINEESQKEQQMYFLVQGKISIMEGAKEIKVIESHDPVLEKAKENSSLRFVALEPTTCLSVKPGFFENIFGCSLCMKVAENFAREAIKNSRFLNKLSQLYIEKMIPLINIKEYEPNETVFEEFDYYENIVLICDGAAMQKNSKRLIPSGRIWKEKFLRKELRMKK
jgi:hypothetical protein